jgi:hypothetical protein
MIAASLNRCNKQGSGNAAINKGDKRKFPIKIENFSEMKIKLSKVARERRIHQVQFI